MPYPHVKQVSIVSAVVPVQVAHSDLSVTVRHSKIIDYKGLL
jgi:hypothetical protein